MYTCVLTFLGRSIDLDILAVNCLKTGAVGILVDAMCDIRRFVLSEVDFRYKSLSLTLSFGN